MAARSITIALALALAGAQTQDRTYYEARFFEWLQEHDIKPLDGSRFVHFLQNFAENDDFITAHNARKDATYTVGHNQFSHMSLAEWREYVHLGLSKPDPSTPAAGVLSAPADLSSVPASIDWTSKGAVTPVKDQGQCGSCWSFSAVGAMEGAYELKYGKLVSFSEQNFVSCDNRSTGGKDMGCKGGLMDNAFDWAAKNGGVCTEADYPYTSGTTKVNGDCNQSSCTKVAQVAPKSHTDVQKNSDSAMMTALAQQPVSVAIEADQKAFQLYKSGVFSDACGSNLDHGVLAVGYGSLNGQDYYKVKNSWGSSWGQDGYILLARGGSMPAAGQCGILSSASFPNL